MAKKKVTKNAAKTPRKKTATKAAHNSKGTAKQSSSTSAAQPADTPAGSSDLPQTEQALLNKLRSLCVEHTIAEAEAQRKKEAYTQAKSKADDLKNEVLDLIRRTAKPATPIESASDKDGWKTVHLNEVLGKRHATVILSKIGGQLDREDLGSLTDWLKRHTLQDIPKVGPGAAGKMMDAMEDFWRRNPQWCDTDGKGASPARRKKASKKAGKAKAPK